jgi:iron complex outermembrane receptor protein
MEARLILHGCASGLSLSRLIAAGVLALGLWGFPLEAQSSESPEDGGQPESDYILFPEEGPTLTVTGRPQPDPAAPVSGPYGSRNVVTEDQIREQGSLDILDSLRNVPGVMVSKRNILGTNTGTSLYIRGRGATHPSIETITMFDGVPRNGMIYGQSMADGIPVFAAGSVEIYKSPQPSVFGTGYGIVNIQPLYMRAEGMEVRTGFSAGSFGTFADNEALGWKSGKFDIYAAHSWVTTEGHTEHSGASQQSYYLNAGFRINTHWEARFLANSVEAATEQPRAKDQLKSAVLSTYDTNTAFSTITLNNNFDKAAGFLKFYYNDTDFYWRHESGIQDDWSKQPATGSGLRARESFFPWEGTEFVAGLDLDKTLAANEDHNSGFESDGVTPRKSVYTDFPDMTLYSPYVAFSQYLGETEGLHLVPSAAARAYLHNLWANGFAPQAGLVFGYANTDLRFNYAWGLVYPAPATIQILANDPAAFEAEDLKRIKPEIVYHYEAGITHTQPGLFTLGGSVFYDDGRNRIIASWTPAAPVNDVSSASYFRITGAEAYGSLRLFDSFELFTGGTWMNVRAKSKNGKEVNKLPYTPAFAGSAGFRWSVENFRLSGDFQYIRGIYAGTLMRSAGFSDPSPAAKMDDQYLLNMRISYTIDHEPWNLAKAEIFFSADNILNRTYEYYYNYEMPGIAFMVGADIKFN